MSIVPMRRRGPEFRIAWIVAIVIVLLVFGRSLCSLFIDYLWWQEMGQVGTWLRMWMYHYAPTVGGMADRVRRPADRPRARHEARGRPVSARIVFTRASARWCWRSSPG